MKNLIRKIITLSLAVGLTTALTANQKNDNTDNYIVPVRSIFISQMMPRYVGTTSK